MFWAITCEAGKRYSQVPAESFRVSMAALEPRDNIPSSKQVSLMLENKGKEFLLCTLEYDRVMQVNLDLRFGCGEEYVFFVNGEGIIHLSGHIMESVNMASEKQLYDNLIENMSMGQVEPCIASDDDEEESLIEEVDEEVAGTHRLLALDDSEDEGSEEWKPGVSDFDDIFAPSYAFGARPETRSKSSKKKVNFAEICDTVDDSYVLPEVDIVDELADVEDMNEDSEDDEDEDGDYEPNENDDGEDGKDEDEESSEEEEEENENVPNHVVEALVGSKKRKKQSLVNDVVKRTKSEVKSSRPMVIEYVGMTSESKKAKKKLKKKQAAIRSGGSPDEDAPMRKQFASRSGGSPNESASMRKQTAIHSRGSPNEGSSMRKQTAIHSGGSPNEDVMNSSIGRTPMPKKKSGILKANMNSNEKHSAEKPMRFSNKLPSGIEYEDLKVGSGPPARTGKLVHMYYMGSLPSGKVFDKVSPPAKPLTFRLGRNEVLKGLDIGLEGMRVGGKRCLKIPAHMGYGKKARENIPANSMLLFNVDLRAVC